MDARPDSWCVLEGGPCDDETMLLVGELVELAVHQLRPPIGVRLLAITSPTSAKENPTSRRNSTTPTARTCGFAG